jgi:hypothetical protein
MTIRSMTATAAVVVTMQAIGAAQTPAPPPAPAAPPLAQVAPRPIDRSDLRRHIYTMEGALSRAVAFGAQRLNREVRSVMPEMIALSGEPQARGVYLDGYGVFFDVGVPVLHQSMFWSLRTMLGQDQRSLTDALNVLKKQAKELDGPRRAATENAIARLELQIGPIPDQSDVGVPTLRAPAPTVGAALSGEMRAQSVGASGAPQDAPPAPQVQQWLDKKYLQDPNALNRAYTEAVQRAVIEAMIDYSVPMAVAPDEYLTVAARDNMQRDALAPPDPYEEIVTIMYRIKGSDLAAYRAGQIDREEVRKRVQVREF